MEIESVIKPHHPTRKKAKVQELTAILKSSTITEREAILPHSVILTLR